jgi:hypothetical protein
MDGETRRKIEMFVYDSFREIADHAFQEKVNSRHIRKIKNNLTEIMSICQKEIESVAPAVAIRTRIKDSSRMNILKIAYAMSRFDYPIINKILGTRYNQSETFNRLEKLTGVKSATLKNMRDRFDPYVEQEGKDKKRKGWHQVQLSSDYEEIRKRYDKEGEDFIAEEIKSLLSSEN